MMSGVATGLRASRSAVKLGLVAHVLYHRVDEHPYGDEDDFRTERTDERVDEQVHTPIAEARENSIKTHVPVVDLECALKRRIPCVMGLLGEKRDKT